MELITAILLFVFTILFFVGFIMKLNKQKKLKKGRSITFSIILFLICIAIGVLCGCVFDPSYWVRKHILMFQTLFLILGGIHIVLINYFYWPKWTFEPSIKLETLYSLANTCLLYTSPSPRD